MRIFSDICGDNNPIHLDPIEAKNSIFGGTIVHGEDSDQTKVNIDNDKDNYYDNNWYFFLLFLF